MLTEYYSNAFNQNVWSKNPSGKVKGKTYYENGLLKSEFVLANPSVFIPGMTVNGNTDIISQTRYTYDVNGRTRFIEEASDNSSFKFDSPELWIVTKYEYDVFGNKIKVTRDALVTTEDNLSGTHNSNPLNLVTKYEYN